MSSANILVFSAVKRLSFSILFLFVMTAANAQVLTEAQVPPPVVAAFQKSFPGAPVKWEKGAASTYEATFKKETSIQVYVYDQAGVLQLKKQKSAMAQMPASVQQSVSASHPGATQTQAYKVISRTQEKYFEVQVVQANGSERLRFDLEGNPVGNANVAATTPAPKPAASTPAPKPTVEPAPKPAVAASPTAKPAVASPAPAPKPAVAANTPAPKPVAPSPAPAPKPSIASATPAPKPAAVSPKPAPAGQPAMAMRGDNAATVKPAKMDDDMDIDMDEDIDIDVLDEEDTFEDIDGLLEDHDDDSDLLLEEDDDDWLELDDDDDEL